MKPELGHFDGYFHLFAALDLAYAGSEQFSTTIDNKILNITKTVKPNIDEELDRIKNKMILMQAEEEYQDRTNNLITNKIKKIENEATQKLQKISNSISAYKHPAELSKSMFLSAGLYCVCYLLLSGYQQFFSSEEYTNNTLMFMNWASLYILVVFIAGYFIENKDYSISPIVPIFIFIVIMVGCRYYCQHYHDVSHQPAAEPGKESTDVASNEKILSGINIAVLIAFLPYLLHIARVFAEKLKNWLQYRYADFRIRRRIVKIEILINFAFLEKVQSTFYRCNIRFPLVYILNEIIKPKKVRHITTT